MKIVVDVVGSEKVKELTASIKEQEANILSWNKQMQTANPIMKQVFQTGMQQSAQHIMHAKDEIKNIEAASSGFGRSLGQLSYAIDDVQYGFNAIVNNIPQIVMSLGGSMGLAGAIGIVAVAINQLIKHWTEVTALFEAGFSNQSYDQLVAVKQAAEKAAESYVKLAAAKTQWEEKGGKKAGEAVADAGANKLRTVIAATLAATGEGAEMTEQERKAVESVKNAKPEIKKGVEDRVKKRLQEENAKEAETILGKLDAGGEVEQKARSRLAHIIKQNREAFDKVDPEFAKKFGESDPAIIKKREEEEKAAKIGQKAREEQKVADKEKEESEKKIRKGITERLQAEKAVHIQSLEDERTAINDKQRAFDEQMWEKQHMAGQRGQFGEGAKSFIDYYKGAGTGDDAKALAKQAHDQRVQTNKELADINKKLEKERRLVVPN